MEWSEVLGHVASALSSVAFIPQVYYTWKTKSVKDLQSVEHAKNKGQKMENRMKAYREGIERLGFKRKKETRL